jgi:hypothetical protein
MCMPGKQFGMPHNWSVRVNVEMRVSKTGRDNEKG